MVELISYGELKYHLEKLNLILRIKVLFEERRNQMRNFEMHFVK